MKKLLILCLFSFNSFGCEKAIQIYHNSIFSGPPINSIYEIKCKKVICYETTESNNGGASISCIKRGNEKR